MAHDTFRVGNRPGQLQPIVFLIDAPHPGWGERRP